MHHLSLNFLYEEGCFYRENVVRLRVSYLEHHLWFSELLTNDPSYFLSLLKNNMKEFISEKPYSRIYLSYCSHGLFSALGC